MEAGPTPQAQPPPPARPPTTGSASEDRAGGSWRVLGLVLALALASASAVMVAAMLDIGSTPTCEDVLSGAEPLPADDECFDGSSSQKVVSLVLGWPSGVLAGIAALLALSFAFSGRRGRQLVMLTAAA